MAAILKMAATGRAFIIIMPCNWDVKEIVIQTAWKVALR